jgi:hypothetical protein
MSRRSKITTMPKAVKAWLDEQLVQRNFAGYELLVEEVNALLEQHDADFRLSRSGVHRYGQEFERQLAAIRLATEQARAVAEAVPDDENALGDALIRIVQQKCLSKLIELDDAKPVGFGTLAKIASETGFASTNVKEFRKKVKDKAAAAAAEVADTARSAGLDDHAVEQIRRRILGIAD